MSGEGIWGVPSVFDSCGGWSKAGECKRVDESRRVCTPGYTICSSDLVDVTGRFTSSHGDVFVNGSNGFTNERAESHI